MRTIRFVSCFFLFFLSTNLLIQAQSKTLQSSMRAAASIDRERDGLNGPVRRLRVETAKILFKNGKTVEAPRVVQEILLYDQKGGRIDSVAYPAEASSLPGKEEYTHDSKGNVVEMTLRGDDGSILSKEKYDYEFDQLDNWKKKITSVAIFEDGKVSYEPIEVTYRAITYYYSQAIAKVTSPANDRASAPASATEPLKAVKPDTERPENAKPAATSPANDRASAPANATEPLKAVKPDTERPENAKTAVTSPANDRAATASATEPLKAVKPDTERPENAKTTEVNVASDIKTSTTTPDVKPIKPDEVKTPIAPASTVVNTSPTVNPPVIRMSEEALRKLAIELPQPQYPAEAIVAGLEGKIEVQLLIDANGEVSSVRAVSGNSLLTEAAEQSARRARFGALDSSNQGAKMFGVITYNFVLPPHAEKAPSVSPAPVSNSIVGANENKPSQGTPQTVVPAASKVELAVKEDKASAPVVLKSPESATSRTSAAEPPLNSLSSATPFEKGMASLASGKYAVAVDFFNQAVQRDPKDALAYCRLGLAHSALQHHKEAIAAFKQAINLNRAFVDIDSYFRLGSAYIGLGDHQAAVKPLKNALYMIKAQALDSDQRKPAPGTPALMDVRYALGLALYGSASFRDAAKEFEAVIRLREDFASAHYGLGLSYLGYGDKSSAERQERILRTLKSPLADKLTNMLMIPGVIVKNKVF